MCVGAVQQIMSTPYHQRTTRNVNVGNVTQHTHTLAVNDVFVLEILLIQLQ